MGCMLFCLVNFHKCLSLALHKLSDILLISMNQMIMLSIYVINRQIQRFRTG